MSTDDYARKRQRLQETFKQKGDLDVKMNDVNLDIRKLSQEIQEYENTHDTPCQYAQNVVDCVFLTLWNDKNLLWKFIRHEGTKEGELHIHCGCKKNDNYHCGIVKNLGKVNETIEFYRCHDIPDCYSCDTTYTKICEMDTAELRKYSAEYEHEHKLYVEKLAKIESSFINGGYPR